MKSGYVTLKYTGPVGRKATLLFAGCIEMCGCVVWGGGTAIRWYLRPLPLLYTLMKAYLQTPNFLLYIVSEFHAIRDQHSLGSKRLRSPYCAKVGVREVKGEGEKEKPLFITFPFYSSFLLSFQLCRRTRAETLTTQAIFNKGKVSSW